MTLLFMGSYVLMESKLCSNEVEVMFLWGRSYVLVGSKLCSLYGNVIEKDLSLGRE